MAGLRTVRLLSIVALVFQAAIAGGGELESPAIDLKSPLPADQQIVVATIKGTDHLPANISCRIDTEVTAADGTKVRGSYYGTVKRADAEGVMLSVVYFHEQREKKSRFDKLPGFDGLAKPIENRGSLDNKEMWFPAAAVKQIAWCGLSAVNAAKAAAQQDVAIVATSLPPERLRQIIDQTRLGGLAPTDWHSIPSAPVGSLCRVEASEKTGVETTFIVYEGTAKTADKNGILLMTTRKKEWKDPTRTFVQQLPLVDLFFIPKPVDVPWQEMNNQCIWIPVSNIHDVLVPRGKVVAKAR